MSTPEQRRASRIEAALIACRWYVQNYIVTAPLSEVSQQDFDALEEVYYLVEALPKPAPCENKDCAKHRNHPGECDELPF